MNTHFFKKNWYFFTPALIILIPVLMMLYCTAIYGYNLSESMKSVFNIGNTGTRYSQKFSESKFKLVHPGMDVRSVFLIIANPMERLDNDTRWRYSLPASGAGHYHERSLIFAKDKNGIPRVKEVVSRFSTP